MSTHLQPRSESGPKSPQPAKGTGRAPQFALTVPRLLVGLAFVLSGLPKLAAPAWLVASFDRWGLPVSELFVPAVGVLEVVCGALLALGVATRYVALLLAADMAGAILTAGLVDGGFHLVGPAVLGLLCLLLAFAGGGAWQLRPLGGRASAGPRAGDGRPSRLTRGAVSRLTNEKTSR